VGAFSRDRRRRDVDDRFALELRGRQRPAGVAGGTGNQLRHRTRFDHGGALWASWYGGSSREAGASQPAPGVHVRALSDRPWIGFHRAALRGPLARLPEGYRGTITARPRCRNQFRESGPARPSRKPLRVCSAEYPLHHIRPAWVEQDPEDWCRQPARLFARHWRKFRTRRRESGAGREFPGAHSAAARSRRPAAAPCHDMDGPPCRAEAVRLAEQLGAEEIHRITGNRPDAFYGLRGCSGCTITNPRSSSGPGGSPR